jgi:NAD-dependent dihydropyrimidine dehydrogenase PreA subunit/flavodoxin
MSRMLIHYFTGTGNTARAVGRIKAALTAAGREVEAIEVRAGVVAPAGRYDAHLVAFPVLAFSAPALMKRYLHALPPGEGVPAAVLAVNGAEFENGAVEEGYAGQAIEQIEAILCRKGYEVLLTGGASYPENFTQLVEPADEGAVSAMLRHGDEAVDTFIQKYMSGRREMVRIGLFRRILTAVPAGLFSILGRRLLGKFYIADARCNGCGICARACPAHTIRLWRGWPRWRAICEDCNRCINICPKKAIQFSVPLAVLHLALHFVFLWIGIGTILAWAPRLLPIAPSLVIMAEIATIGVFLVLMLWFQAVPLDFLFNRLARVKPVRWFFSLSWTRRYRRYTAPGFKPLKHGEGNEQR